jgi:hypothetical protein
MREKYLSERTVGARADACTILDVFPYVLRIASRFLLGTFFIFSEKGFF